MNTHVFLIIAKSNLHVGNESGGEFSIIDKAIQRDPLTSLPCINSSSLKGAIKEFCVHNTNVNVGKYFGSDVDKETGKVKAETQKGQAIFFDAKLLFLPQQDDRSLYHYATSDDVIKMMNERVKLFNPKFTYEKPSKFHDKDVVTCNERESLSALCHDDNLPIIARNVLENGESNNLWYEQVLPAETVLYTIIQEEGNDVAEALDGQIVQIGANATIGYGYCKFEWIK